MIGFAPWQALLDGLGWVVAEIYDVVPNYGVTIILLTILIRVLLLPVGIRQVRSMQHMQIIQPKVKQIQQKYKGNKQRQQEEIMKMYREYGVNPLAGCWPVLVQLPILFAMFSVLRLPSFEPVVDSDDVVAYEVLGNHLPTDSELFRRSMHHEGTDFLTMNLQCTPVQVWSQSPDATPDTVGNTVQPGLPLRVDGEPTGIETGPRLDCGRSRVAVVPYALMLLLMTGTTYFQQRQMQKASPPGAASQQQQAILKFLPLMFLVFGINFPAGLILYWTTSNFWQIGQQYFMLRTRPSEEALAAAADGKRRPEKKGFMASMMERADEDRKRRAGTSGRPGTPRRRPGTPKPGAPKPGSRKPGGQKRGNPKPGTGREGSDRDTPGSSDTGGDGGGDPTDGT